MENWTRWKLSASGKTFTSKQILYYLFVGFVFRYAGWYAIQNEAKLHEFSIDVAQFSTGHFSVKLPTTEFALNGRGAPDCAIFDFTNLYSARNACRVKVKKGRDLLMTVVGDSLLEPFWPEGTGCARGFLSAIDAAWMFRRWVNGKLNPLEIICERENIYK